MSLARPVRSLASTLPVAALVVLTAAGCSAGVTNAGSTPPPVSTTTPPASSPAAPGTDVSTPAPSDLPSGLPSAATGASGPGSGGATAGAGAADLPPGFPLPPGSTLDGVTRDDDEIDARVTLADGAQAFEFWKAALPGAGYPVASAEGVGGIGEIRFSGNGCGGNSQIALTGSSAAVQCDLG